MELSRGMYNNNVARVMRQRISNRRYEHHLAVTSSAYYNAAAAARNIALGAPIS